MAPCTSPLLVLLPRLQNGFPGSGSSRQRDHGILPALFKGRTSSPIALHSNPVFHSISTFLSSQASSQQALNKLSSSSGTFIAKFQKPLAKMKFAVFTAAIASAATFFTGAVAAPQPAGISIVERAASSSNSSGSVSVIDLANDVRTELNNANAKLRKFLIFSIWPSRICTNQNFRQILPLPSALLRAARLSTT